MTPSVLPFPGTTDCPTCAAAEAQRDAGEMPVVTPAHELRHIEDDERQEQRRAATVLRQLMVVQAEWEQEHV